MQEYPEKPMNPRLQIILDAIPSGSTVLDVACGTGRVLYAATLKGCRGRGIELSAPGVQAAQQKGLDVLRGDVDLFEKDPAVRELLFARYDVAIFSKCLMYLKRKNEMMRHLNTDAIIIFQANPCYTRRRFTAFWKNLFRRIFDKCDLGSNHSEEALPYCFKNGEEIKINSPHALAAWAASYGYVHSELLYGGSKKSMIVKLSH